MPFASKAQQKFLYSHPDRLGKKALAEWSSKTNFSKLPEHVKSTGKKRTSNMSKNPMTLDTPLQCKDCGGSFSDGKCPSCGSHVAIARSQFETDQHLRSRLDGGNYFVHFGKLEEPGPEKESHRDEQE
jgi:predicted Zn-ribbon and HTH transcriptional regulator